MMSTAGKILRFSLMLLPILKSLLDLRALVYRRGINTPEQPTGVRFSYVSNKLLRDARLPAKTH